MFHHQHSVIISGHKISYNETQGHGVPVFLVHGNSLSSEVFKNQLSSPMLKGLHLIAPDLPGHGHSFRSSAPDVDYHLPNLITLLTCFINSFGFKAYFLYGNSLGGHLLINCLPFLNGVEGIAINGTPPLSSPPDMAACYLPNPVIPLAFKPNLSEKEMNQMASAFCNPNSDKFSSLVEIIKNTDPEFRRVVGAGLMTGNNNDEIEILKQANVPMAIFHGNNDEIVNPGYFEQINVKKWDNKVHFIENAGHLPFFENGERFNVVLASFISALL